MRATSIVRKICAVCRPQVHAARFAAVMTFVDALLRADQLTLTALGRALPGGSPKHQIKRADHFLGNPHLHRELTVWYRALIQFVVGTVERPVILVDWTQVAGEFYALSATMPYEGRSLPLYHQVHPRRRYNSRKVHERFLEHLRAVLPPTCRPIIIADAGFRSPFFLACRMTGFDYVIRLRGNGKIWRGRKQALKLTHLFAAAGAQPQCLGEWTPFDSGSGGITARIIVGARPARGARRRGKPSAYYRKQAREPWVLATSLTTITAAQVVALYATRMRIEETFRDIKNPRFGWALSYSASRSAQRFAVLLLLASLALVAVLLVGAAAESAGVARSYQANTIKSRRVLSLFALGRLVLRDLGPAVSSLAALAPIPSISLAAAALVPAGSRRYGFNAAHDVGCPHCGRGWIR